MDRLVFRGQGTQGPSVGVAMPRHSFIGHPPDGVAVLVDVLGVATATSSWLRKTGSPKQEDVARCLFYLLWGLLSVYMSIPWASLNTSNKRR